MGRTRTKSKNLRRVPPKTSDQFSSASSSTTPSIPALISKAQTLIEQCDYDLANQFIQRILQRSPNNVEARDAWSRTIRDGSGPTSQEGRFKVFYLLSFLNWYTQHSIHFRISRPTTPRCCVYTYALAILAFSSIERWRSPSRAPVLPIRTAHPDRAGQGKGMCDRIGLRFRF